MDNLKGPTSCDAWKIFNKDTEAGRILSRLYGVAPTRRVTYPNLKSRRTTSNGDETADHRNRKGSWKTTYTVSRRCSAEEEEKERERKKKALNNLLIPRVGRSKSIPSNIAQHAEIPRRKTETECRNSIKEVIFKNRSYRPPYTRSISSEEEKNKLQQIMMDGKRSPHGDSLKVPSRTPTENDHGIYSKTPTTLVDQLVSEIIERRQHQIAMDNIGAGEASRESTAIEIKKRIEHLKRLDPHLASAITHKLTTS